MLNIKHFSGQFQLNAILKFYLFCGDTVVINQIFDNFNVLLGPTSVRIFNQPYVLLYLVQ